MKEQGLCLRSQVSLESHTFRPSILLNRYVYSSHPYPTKIHITFFIHAVTHFAKLKQSSTAFIKIKYILNEQPEESLQVANSILMNRITARYKPLVL